MSIDQIKNQHSLRTISLAILMLMVFCLPAQVEQFKSTAHKKPELNYNYKLYGCISVKSIGFGFQYQQSGQLSWDASLYYRIGAGIHGLLYGVYDDYNSLHGPGFQLNPRIHFGRMSIISIGPYISTESVSHPQIWTANSKDEYISEDAHGYIFSAGMYAGFKFVINTTLVEPFISVGNSFVNLRGTYYGSASSSHPNGGFNTSPVPVSRREQYIYGNFGVKLGTAWHRSKHMVNAEKKFNDVYNPLLQAMSNSAEQKKELHELPLKAYKSFTQKYESYTRTHVYLDYKKLGTDSLAFYQSIDRKLQQLKSIIDLNTGVPHQYDGQYEKKSK